MSQLRRITTLISDVYGCLIGQHNIGLHKPFLKSFEVYGIPVTKEEALKPTGVNKKEHITEVLRIPSVIAKFEKERKRKPDLDKDTKEIFKIYEPLQIEVLSNPDFIRPLPGVIETLQKLREMDIKLVATTGFKSTMVKTILANSEEKIGQYFLDVVPCDDHRIKRSRPEPDQIWASMIIAGATSASSCLNVDDTSPGIIAGNNAGVKTVAVTRYGNFTGLFTEDIDVLEKADPKAARLILKGAHEHIEKANPTYICQSFANIISLINFRNTISDRVGK